MKIGQIIETKSESKKIFSKKIFLDFTISGCLLKDGKLNEAIYFYQSGRKSSKVPYNLENLFLNLQIIRHYFSDFLILIYNEKIHISFSKGTCNGCG